jgi:hypothetical protein
MQHLLSGWHGIETNRKFNKKESANELARLSLYKEAGLNKRPDVTYARYQQLRESKLPSEFDSNVATEFHFRKLDRDRFYCDARYWPKADIS